MKTWNVYRCRETDKAEFTATYGRPENEIEWCGASFGSEPLEHATPQDVERYRGRSALNELERVLFVLAAQSRFNRK